MTITRRTKTTALPADLPAQAVENYGAAFASFAFRNPGWVARAVKVINEHRNFGKHGIEFMLANELKKAYELGLSRAPEPEGEFPPDEVVAEPIDAEMEEAAINVQETTVATYRDRFMVGPDVAARRRRLIDQSKERLEAAGGAPERPAPTRVLSRPKPAATPVKMLIRRR